jgi:hypothetical protein
MKAHKGEEIVCDCPRPAGNFLRDIDEDARISSEDIAISLPGAHDDLGRWVCPDCKEQVAQRFAGDQWCVRTRRGLLQ